MKTVRDRLTTSIDMICIFMHLGICTLQKEHRSLNKLNTVLQYGTPRHSGSCVVLSTAYCITGYRYVGDNLPSQSLDRSKTPRLLNQSLD